MRALLFSVAFGLIALSVSAAAVQQTDTGITAKGAIGEVKAIDATAKQITIKTDAGSIVVASYTDKTTYKKLAPGEQSLMNATDIALADVGEGDRVWARGTVAEDRKSLPAAMIVVMSKATSRRSRRPSVRSGVNAASLV